MLEITLGPDKPVAIRIMIVVSVFLFIALVAAGLRIPARRFAHEKLDFSDYSAFLALFFVVGLSAAEYVAGISGGFGIPLDSSKAERFNKVTTESLKFGWLLWACANTCVRLSMLHLLHSIFWSSRPTSRAIYALGSANIIYLLAVIIEFGAICRPFNFFWSHVKDGVCGDVILGYLIIAVFNCLLDICLIILPLPSLWKLKIPVHRKVGISLIFSMGLVICAITMVRIVTLNESWKNQAESISHPSAHSAHARSVNIYHDALLTIIEPSLGVFNASIPMYPPIYRALSHTAFWQRCMSTISTVTGHKHFHIQETELDSKQLHGGSDEFSIHNSRKQSDIDVDVESGPDSFLEAELAGMDMRGMKLGQR